MGAAIPTVTLAVAALPAPPAIEVTALVTLTFVPFDVAVTLTVKTHDAFAASDAPVRLTGNPAVAVIVPPPQAPVSPLGVDTTNPAGNVSVKPMWVNVVPALVLLMVKLSVVVPAGAMLDEPKDFAIV